MHRQLSLDYCDTEVNLLIVGQVLQLWGVLFPVIYLDG